MLHLICIPAGYSAAGPFFDKDFTHNNNGAMLIASSRSLVQNARLRGINAANFDYLANEVLRFCGLHRARKISRRTQELILGDILDRLLRRGTLTYFAELVSKKGFLHAVTVLMDQIGSCGVTPEELETAFSHWDGRSLFCRRKDAEVSVIYREYLSYLIKNDLFDVQGLYRIAAEGLSAIKNRPCSFFCKTLYFTGFYQFDALQLEIIRQLSRFLDVWVALPYEAGRPELYGATEYTYGALMEYAVEEHPALPVPIRRTASLCHIVQNLRNPGRMNVPADDGVEIWQMADKRSEVRSVLREIKGQIRDHAVRPDEIAVVLRRMDEYSGIRALCDEYGIPVQMDAGASLSSNPLFRYVLSLLQLVSLHGREKAEACIRFLSLPLQRFAVGLRIETVLQVAGKRYYTDYEAFMKCLFETAEDIPVELHSLWQEIEQIPYEATVDEYCKRLTDILASLSLLRKMGSQYRCGAITLKEFKNIACALELINEILKMLPQDYSAGGFAEKTVSCTDFSEIMAETAEGKTISLSPENGEGIAVLSAVNLEDVTFRQVYILGLQENRFPFLKNENWIYDDRERNELASLGIALPCSADGYKEDIHFFANACAAAQERLVLTFSTEDDQIASPYINEIKSLFTELKIQQKTAVPKLEESLSKQELELGLVRNGAEDRLGEITDLLLVEAGGSDRKRIRNEETWNGKLKEPSLIEDVSKNIGNRFSASGLEDFRKCPFRFLVRYGWRQQEAENAEEDISPMQRGDILHVVLERFINLHLNEQLAACRWDVLQDELEMVFSAVCREMEEKGILYAGDFWRLDREQLRLMLQRWLKQEIEYSAKGSFVPVYTEKEFGRKNAVGVSVGLNSGEQIFLNGKIDRIDKAGNVYYITDYKSGDAPGQSGFLDSDLQMPLYILAAEEIIAKPDEATVIGGGYYSLKEGARKNSFLFSDAHNRAKQIPWRTWSEKKDKDGTRHVFTDAEALRKEFHEMLDGMMERIKAGRFVPTPYKECAKFCPAAGICRYTAVTHGCNEEENNG